MVEQRRREGAACVVDMVEARDEAIENKSMAGEEEKESNRERVGNSREFTIA